MSEITPSEHPVDENTELIARLESVKGSAFARAAISDAIAALAKSERELADRQYERDMATRGKEDAYAQLETARQKLAEQEDYWRNRMENGPWARADENLMLQAQIAEQAAVIEAAKRVHRASPTQALADIHFILSGRDHRFGVSTGTTEQEGK